MNTLSKTERNQSVEEIHASLSGFGLMAAGQTAFSVNPGFCAEDGINFTRCVNEYLRQSMRRGVDSSEGVPPSEAWINDLLLEMIDAIGYVTLTQDRSARKAESEYIEIPVIGKAR